MEFATQVHVKAVCVSLHSNAFEKGHKPISSLSRELVLEKENSEFKLVLHCLKIEQRDWVNIQHTDPLEETTDISTN